MSDEQRDAAAIQHTVAAEEAEVATAAAHTLSLKEEAQAELEQVLPALMSAEAALNSLNKTDIIEIRTFSKPPALVQLTLEGVCILLQVGGWGGCMGHTTCLAGACMPCTALLCMSSEPRRASGGARWAGPRHMGA